MASKDKRTAFDKLNTLLFGKDLRITKGEPYTELREYDFSSYFPKGKYIFHQDIPTENVYDIRDFGASAEKDDNSNAINSAFTEAEKTGGTVLVKGGDFVTTTVYMKSGTTLFIEENSSLCSNKTGAGYSNRAIIYAENVKDISFTGGGMINGNGEYFGLKPLYDENMTTHPEYLDVIQMRRDLRAQIRFAHKSKYGMPVYLNGCENVKVNNFMIYNSAYWTFKLNNCNNVEFKNFVIQNNRHVANADGIDITGTSNVNIEHCFISTADDAICLKNAIWHGNKGAMSNIKVRDCELISCANSFKIGTETTYDIEDVSVENCSFMMTDIYPGTVSGIAVESADGAKVRNLKFKNIKMDRVTCPVFIRLCNRNRAASVTDESADAVEFGKIKKRGSSAPKNAFDMKGEVSNIVIENVTAKNAEIPVIIAGFKQGGKTKCVNGVTLKDVDISYAPYKEVYDKRAFIPEYADVYPESWRFRNLPAYGLWGRHVKNLKLLDFNCSVPKSTWKEKLIITD